MTTLKFYLDTRFTTTSGLYPLKLTIHHNRKTALLNLDIKLSEQQWDASNNKVVDHIDQRRLNLLLSNYMLKAESELICIADEGKSDELSASDIKNRITLLIHPEKVANEKTKEKAPVRKKEEKPLFINRFLKFANSKSESTKKVYMQTYRRLLAYLGEDSLNQLTFEEINKSWLVDFENFLAKTACRNARNIHLRNIRAAFNDAIDDEITTNYPFRRFKMKYEQTKKRNLTVEQLREFFNFTPEPYAVKYLDMFKLVFMLIGINVVDLANLKEIENGRLEFRRAKTHRLYSIKVEPEALELIDKLKGKNWLVHIRDFYTDHNDYTRHINRELQKIGGLERKGLGGKKIRTPMFPNITTYWARHSWATIAASLDIPKDTIAHALGHGGNTVTDIYIDFDQSKVDAANRKVLDWVLYGKK